MMDDTRGIAAVGSHDFLLGFSLAGVRDTILADETTVIPAIGKAEGTAIVIVEERLLRAMTPAERVRLETGVHPVILALGPDGNEQLGRLRRQARAILGVDLLR